MAQSKREKRREKLLEADRDSARPYSNLALARMALRWNLTLDLSLEENVRFTYLCRKSRIIERSKGFIRLGYDYPSISSKSKTLWDKADAEAQQSAIQEACEKLGIKVGDSLFKPGAEQRLRETSERVWRPRRNKTA